jgi:hypothetical protein
MPIDPSIAGGYRGIQIADPMAQYAQMVAIQNAQNQNIAAQNQNALAQYQLGSAQRSDVSANALNAAYRDAVNPDTGELNYNELMKRLAGGGAAGQIPGVLKQQSEAAAAALTREKTQGDIAAQRTKQLDDKLKQSRELLGGIDPNSPTAAQDYIAWHEANHADPIIGPALTARGATPSQARARIDAALQTPGGLARLIEESKLGVEKFAEMNKPIAMRPGGTLMTPGGAPIATVAPTPLAPPAPPSRVAAYTFAKTPEGGNFKGTLLEFESKLKAAGRTPAQESAPVAIVGPDGKPVYTTRAGSLGQTPAASMEGLTPKEIQKREASFPQSQASFKSIENSGNSLIADMTALRNHPGLASITGIAAGRLPGFTPEGRAAQALYDKIVAKGGFQMLQDLRNASKTGGALGNVSNQEGSQLKSAFAAIDRKQEAKDVMAALDEAITNTQGSMTRTKEAFDTTYEYRTGAKPGATPGANPHSGKTDAQIKKELGI